MALEKQILPNKTYRSVKIITLSHDNDAELKKFHESLKKDSTEFFAHTLFFFEVKTSEAEVAYYSFDYFQNVKSLSQLQKLNAKDILKISAQEKDTEITLTEEEDELTNLANIYGYPHNYRSKMYLGRNFGWATGAGIGIFLGIVILVLVLPILFVPVMDVLIKLLIFGPLLFVALCLLEIFITEQISAGLGAIIGAGMGALVHYCEKTFTQHKIQNQEEQDDVKIVGFDKQHPSSVENVNETFSSRLFDSAHNKSHQGDRDDQFSPTDFCVTLFEDTPFAFTPQIKPDVDVPKPLLENSVIEGQHENKEPPKGPPAPSFVAETVNISDNDKRNLKAYTPPSGNLTDNAGEERSIYSMQ